MKRYIRQDYNKDAQFTTVEVSTSIPVESSHIYIGKKSEREQIAESVFELLQTAYDEIGGFKSFRDIQKFINNSYLWYMTYEGPSPSSLDEFDINKVYVVSVFRRKNGLKMVGMARRVIPTDSGTKDEHLELRRNISAAIQEHIRFICDRGWAEVSDRLEAAFQKAVGYKYVIDPEDIRDHHIFNDVTMDIDPFYYWRPLYPGEKPTRKIAYGTIKF